MSGDKPSRARLWAFFLGVFIMMVTWLAFASFPPAQAVIWVGLLLLGVLAGLLTNAWGGLLVSAATAVLVLHAGAGPFRSGSPYAGAGLLVALVLGGPVAGQLASAVSRLQKQLTYWMGQAEAASAHDPTFGALKPAWAAARLEEEIGRAARFGRPLALIVLQLQASAEGDRRPSRPRQDRIAALKAVIRMAQAATDPPAIVSHGGGDTVIVILPEQTPRQAEGTAHQLRQRFSHELYFPPDRRGHQGRPLWSFGRLRVGTVSLNGHPESGQSLLAKAKSALEEASCLS